MTGRSIALPLVLTCILVASAIGCNKGGGDGGGLTGEQVVSRLTAAGWEPMTDPRVDDNAGAKTTTFMSKPPKTVTVMVMEYKSSRIGKAAFEALKKGNTTAEMVGDTILTVSGGTPEKRQKALKDALGK